MNTSNAFENIIRSFCSRHYGEVSPLVSKKYTAALMRRHQQDLDMAAPEVQDALRQLEAEGLIRVLGRDDAYFKMLGAE